MKGVDRQGSGEMENNVLPYNNNHLMILCVEVLQYNLTKMISKDTFIL